MMTKEKTRNRKIKVKFVYNINKNFDIPVHAFLIKMDHVGTAEAIKFWL